MYFLLLHFLASSVWAVHCPQLFSDGTVLFGDAYDRFVDGDTPKFEEIRGKRWRLKGVASHHDSVLDTDSAHDSGGYRIATGTVPELTFADRKTLGRLGRFGSLLSWAPTDDFVVLENWGRAADEEAEPSFAINWPVDALEKQGAIAFSVPLYDNEGPKLFLRNCEGVPYSRARLYLECRLNGQTLICMAELKKAETRNRRPVPTCISDFLWFGP